MEAAKSGAGGAGQRHRGRGPALYHRPWSPVSGAGTSGVHRPGGVALVRAGGPRGGGGVGGAGARGLFGGGGLSPRAPFPVVVGGRRRAGGGRGWGGGWWAACSRHC